MKNKSYPNPNQESPEDKLDVWNMTSKNAEHAMFSFTLVWRYALREQADPTLYVSNKMSSPFT